jgi:putative ABC transport system permease protein
MAPGDLPRLREVHPDASVLAVSLVLAVTAGIAVGILPALFAGRTDVRAALQDAARGSVGSRASHRARSGLVVAEIALALVLTVAAGLLLRSFGRLLDVDPGFRVDDVLTLELNLPARLATADARRAFYAVLFERLDALPGVISTGGTTRIPLGSTNSTTTVQIEGRPAGASEQPTVDFRRAMHDYFTTMGIPVLRGRRFTSADGPASPAVAVINQTMAQRLFANEDPIGRRVRIGPNASGSWTTIVGIIGDVHHSRIDADPEPELYISSIQNPPVAPFIALRTTGNPADLAEMVRSTARALDPTLLVYDIRTMAQIRSEALAERRFLVLLIGLFGALAIVLASVGVYGVITLVVSERTKEIGVRLALGAEPWRVLRMVVGDAIRLALAGTCIGLVLAAALSPLIRAQLFGVRPLDPLTFTVTAIGLVTVAAIAAAVPAWRAMRIDPMQAINSL